MKPINRKVEWEEFLSLIIKSSEEIKARHNDIDTIVVLSRGGLIPGAIIAQKLNVKRVYSFGINFYSSGNKIRKVPNIYQPLPTNFFSSNILIIDDIIDSGKSIKHVLKYINKSYYSDNEPLVYSVFYKPNELGVHPDFYGEYLHNKEWVEFPWEIKNDS